jgi:V-type H+-transporting ATPase subunit C
MEDKLFWLISVPKNAAPDVFGDLNRQTMQQRDLSQENNKFEIPDLKVGTLNSLMELSDELNKIDLYVESMTRKIAKQLFDLMEKKPDKFNIPIIDTNADQYLTRFKWEDARFPRRKSLRELVDLVHANVGKLDEELRQKAIEYNTLNQSIYAQEKKESGSLIARDLTNIIKKEDVTDSTNLTTLFVVVSRSEEKAWLSSYETLTNYVVPRSSHKVFEDNENGLWSVVLFKRVTDDFKNAARENKFIVRKYEPSVVLDPEAKKKQITERDRQKRNLSRWCKTNFAEAFIAWIHLKCIRCFVESVLRFGLPADFQAMLILPKNRQEKKLRDTLNEMYKNLGRNLANDEDLDMQAPGGLVLTNEKFYPYVSLEINLDMQN